MTADARSGAAERGRRIKQLFDAAIEVSASDRASYLDDHCGGDRDLRDEVETLLAALEQVRTSDVLPPLPLDVASATRSNRAFEKTKSIAGASSARDVGAGLERGDAIGRFVVLGMVGRGGMGEVYAAYDPELDRRIAVKLLRNRKRRSQDGRARMLREAQAIARLSHPNVVVIYDVGTVGDRVFIAMEFIEGSTVRVWLNERKRNQREILDVFLAAGQGLAAAHEVGMVHRDFKPDNVMITESGKVRVMDFGLARQVLGDDEERLTTSAVEQKMAESRTITLNAEAGRADSQMGGVAKPAATPLSSGGYLRAKITETGAQIGTPAYMAPEQFVTGGKPDARTDQFSFCVALYEALYGERPFPGETTQDIKAQVLSGAVRPSPAHSKVPGWIRRVLLRGLSTDPGDRFPSMSVLRAALLNDPAKRLKNGAIVAATLVVLLGVAGASHRMGSKQRPLCGDGGTHFAGVWEPGLANSERKVAIHGAFTRSGKTYAEQAFSSVSRLFDDYVNRWIGMYAETCQATNVRGEQSAEVLDLRMACLNERLENVRALSDIFARADGGVVEHSVTAAATLPPLDRCADVVMLRAVDRPPEDAIARRRITELRGELARLIALGDSGQCALAIRKADELIPAVRTGGYAPLLADTLLNAGLLGQTCSEPTLTLDRLREAHLAASASRHDEVAAYASAAISIIAINRLGEIPVGREWLEVARGDVARLGHQTWVSGLLAQAEGNVALAGRHYDRAIPLIDRAIEITRRFRGPDSPETINGEMDKGDWQASAGILDDALRTDIQARAHAEHVLGRDHPSVGLICNNEGEVLNLLGRHAEAAAVYFRSVEIFRASGADLSLLAWPLTGLGRALLGQNQPAGAIAPLEEALAIRLQQNAPPRELGETRFALAQALWPRIAERHRALTLAASARGDAGADQKLISEIDAWMTRVRRERS